MRKVLFRKPFGVAKGTRKFYRAMVNGEWIDGTYAEVNKKFIEGRKFHLKQKVKSK